MTEDRKLLESLLWRGCRDAVIKEDIQKQLASGKKLRIKLGIDPTGSRIHIGHAAVIRKLAHFQKLGHKVVLIVGDFTAQIGDPSDKKAERPPLTHADVKKNMRTYKKQLSRLLNTWKAEVRYNNNWLGKMKFADVIELIQPFSVAQMMERDNFALRHKEGKRVGLHELLYPIMQGYDSVAVKSDIEIGGTDQLFNLLTGRVVQLWHKQNKKYPGPIQDVITYNLLIGPDGRKMSKSWGNCIWIDDEPNEMYGKLMSVNDELIGDYFTLCTDVSDEELARAKEELAQGKNPRDLKARMAFEVTKVFHDADKAKAAADAFDKQFKKKEIPEKIEEFVFETPPKNIAEALYVSGVSESMSAGYRLVEQGGVRINQKKVLDVAQEIESGDTLQAGPRRFKKIIIRGRIQKKEDGR
ncbi:MAG: tyrosine--tRNA ligase [Patescibacteria group bacterium]